MRRRKWTFARAFVQVLSHRILLNVANVLRIVVSVPNSMILESLLPDLHMRTKFLLGLEGEAAFDELNCFLQACQWRDEEIDVVGHDDEFMQKVSGASVVVEGVDKKSCPSIGVEMRTTSPSLRRDHISLACVGRMLPLWSQLFDLVGLKPLLHSGAHGAPEGAPLQNKVKILLNHLGG